MAFKVTVSVSGTYLLIGLDVNSVKPVTETTSVELVFVIHYEYFTSYLIPILSCCSIEWF